VTFALETVGLEKRFDELAVTRDRCESRLARAMP
jgi:hypothetical protein